MIPQEERDNRGQQIYDRLMPYVTPSPNALVMQNQYELVADIARKCESLEKIDGTWAATFWPGDHVGDCCATAYNLFGLTKLSVNLTFNDTNIVIGAEE